MMHIYWSERAYIRRQAIEDYILYSFGRRAHTDYIKEINRWKETLRNAPFAGQVEPNLEGMRKEYRYFVVANQSKAIYYVEGDGIYIVDWWDTRRSIEKLKSGIE